MPKSIGGIFGFAIASVIATAVGIAIISRIKPLWAIVVGK